MPVVDALAVTCHTIPTDEPESDGTLEWDSTTIVIVEASGGGEWGLGYTYGSAACATFVEDKLASAIRGRDALDVPAAWGAMRRAVRNEGQVGIAAMSIAAVDVALWDLAARLHGVALCTLLGRVHDAVPVYGSGGFCSYSDERLAQQLGAWAAAGFGRGEMKVGP